MIKRLGMSKVKPVFFVIFIGLIIYSCSHIDEKKKAKNKTKVNPQQFLEKLEKYGYFSMTDKKELDSSKNYILKIFSEQNYFDFKLFHDSYFNVDYRFYDLDGEELYEEGGLISHLNDLQRTINKLGLKLDYKNEFIRNAGDSLIHSIYLNNTFYMAYEGIYNEYSWDIAAYNFAKMINSELFKQGSQEKVYLISSGNDGLLVFLNKETFNYLRSVFPKEMESPMEIEEWAKYFEIDKYV